MEWMILLVSLPAIFLITFILICIIIRIKDKNNISNVQKQAIKEEQAKQNRSEYLKKVIYDLYKPDEYYHELLCPDIKIDYFNFQVLLYSLYLAYEEIHDKLYSSGEELRRLYAVINLHIDELASDYHIKVEYSDIPVLYQHFEDLMEKIDNESLFAFNNKTIRILSEIREKGKCFCFCIEDDVSSGSPVSMREGYFIFESDIKKTGFYEIKAPELEHKLFERFKKKSRKVREELAEIEKNKNSKTNNNSYANSEKNKSSTGGTYSYSYSKTKQNTSRQDNKTNQNSSQNYRNNTGSSSQNRNSNNNNFQNFSGNKNDLELFIENNSKINKYYCYFIGCKTFSDVKKRRNELVKQFHPDMGNSIGEEISYINPIYEEIKQKFGN